MTIISDPGQVERILTDPGFRVPEADVAATGPFDRFRATVSRFANGSIHDGRRAQLDARLTHLNLGALADAATTRTRRARALADRTAHDAAALAAHVARGVPVASLADMLGFDEADGLAELVALVADRYATGVADDPVAEDAAIERLLALAPGADAGTRALEVQLLVQAWAATRAVIESAMRLLASDDHARHSTFELLREALEQDAPVAVTRRVAPSGELVVLRLDGADLAFGTGARRCPAPHHAIVIATAAVDELRRPLDVRDAVPAEREEGSPDADAD
ncbi:cytochrome P450 [Agromyces humatus]|uniref:Cytochrome P450 n=1 Tax=Agromyces humatus TaxID=279573 RepID=A0ABP4X6X9_9MICO|nr:cytochrome P450 [Agromyces humatus]